MPRRYLPLRATPPVAWSVGDSGLQDGHRYEYVAYVEDAAGNAGTVSAVFTLSVDTTAPSQIVSIVSVIDNVDPGLGTVTNTGITKVGDVADVITATGAGK